jgi:hypothetical protein
MRVISLSYDRLRERYIVVDSPIPRSDKSRKEIPLNLDSLLELILEDFNLKERKSIVNFDKDFPLETIEYLKLNLQKRGAKVKDYFYQSGK